MQVTYATATAAAAAAHEDVYGSGAQQQQQQQRGGQRAVTLAGSTYALSIGSFKGLGLGDAFDRSVQMLLQVRGGGETLAWGRGGEGWRGGCDGRSGAVCGYPSASGLPPTSFAGLF